MIFTLYEDHRLISDNNFLGVSMENKSEMIEIYVEDRFLWDKWPYIEFGLGGCKSFSTSRLSIDEEGVIRYELLNNVLITGNVRLQVVFKGEDDWVWKSLIATVEVKNSLNVTEHEPLPTPIILNQIEERISELEDHSLMDTDVVDNLESDSSENVLAARQGKVLNYKIINIENVLSFKADLVDGKVPTSQLPSYVDDVIEYPSLSDFPEEGEQSKIYVALDTGYTYRWSGSEYVQIGGQDLSNYGPLNGNNTWTGSNTFFYTSIDFSDFTYRTILNEGNIIVNEYRQNTKGSGLVITPRGIESNGTNAHFKIQNREYEHFGIFSSDSNQYIIQHGPDENTIYTLYLPRKDGTVIFADDFATYTPSNQSSSVVVGNALTNINGRPFQNYTATLVEDNYTYYQIYYQNGIVDEERAKEYMRYMTGSNFVPKYNYDNPKQVIFTFADRSTWKPQWDSTNGLRLYRLTTPLALESEIPSNLENGSGINSLQQKTIDTEEPNIASGYESIAFNHETQAIQKACAAFGGGTIAGNRYVQDAASTYGFAFAIGEMSQAYGRGSFSSGNSTRALGMYTSTFGYKTTAIKDWQHVVGAMNSYSHTSEQEVSIPLPNIDDALFIVGNGFENDEWTEGGQLEVKVVGKDAFAIYKDGHAELAVQGTTNKSVVIKESVTTDLRKGTGARSIIQIHGAQANEASGQSAIALGMGNKATATRAVAIGEGLIGNVSNTTYVGKYNNSSISDTLFVVGNGTSNTSRSNAFEVYKDGHATINLMGSTNKSITTKEYVDNLNSGVIKDNLTFSNNLKVYDRDGVDISNQSFADPTVWDGEDGYFYATHTGIDSPIYRSNDLVTWRYSQSGIISSEAKATIITTWGYKNLWAPQVKKINGKFVLYAAAVNEDVSPKKYAIVALTSTIPNGPFQDPVVITTTASSGIGNAIDPYVIRGRDDNLYLFFGSSYGIYYTKLTYDGLSLVKEATFTHIAGQTITQSPNRENVYEGVYIYYNTDYYYMFVSAGHAGTSNYCIKVGRSTSLFGPFKDSNGVDLLNGGGDLILSGTNNNANGPGHNGEIFVDSEGKTYMFYHCHITASPSTHSGQTLNWVRPLFLQEIKWDSNYWPYFDNSGKPQLTNNIIPYLPHASNDGIGQCLTYPKMYNHALHIIDNNSSPKMDIFVSLISINVNSLTKASFAKWLYNYGYISNNRVLCTTGSFGAIGTNYVVGVFSTDGTNLKISYIPNGSTSRTSADVNPSAFGDTVTPLIN